MSARPATAATPQPSLSLAKQSRRSKTPECLLAGRELGASKRGTRSRPLRRIASDATAHRPETAVNADSAWLLASRDLRRQQVGAGRTALGATRATQAGPTDDCWVAKPEAPCGAAGSDRDDRFVAQALASRRSPGGRNRSSGAALADARLWAKAVVWRLAVFASCPRSEPVVSKRSGSRPTSASACWNAPCQLTRRGVRSCNPGRSGSLVGADSQAAEIPQLCSDARKTAARAEQCDSLGGFEWVVAGCWI
jgi:hypothetical protein